MVHCEPSLFICSESSRFIESNKIETASKYAFRGLRDVTHLYVPTCLNILFFSYYFDFCTIHVNYVLPIYSSCSSLLSIVVVVVFRSLANNNIKFLPRDLFIDLDSLIEL